TTTSITLQTPKPALRRLRRLTRQLRSRSRLRLLQSLQRRRLAKLLNLRTRKLRALSPRLLRSRHLHLLSLPPIPSSCWILLPALLDNLTRLPVRWPTPRTPLAPMAKLLPYGTTPLP